MNPLNLGSSVKGRTRENPPTTTEGCQRRWSIQFGTKRRPKKSSPGDSQPQACLHACFCLNPHYEIWKPPLSEVNDNSRSELGLAMPPEGLAGEAKANPPRRATSSISAGAGWSRVSSAKEELTNPNYRARSLPCPPAPPPHIHTKAPLQETANTANSKTRLSRKTK